MNLDPDICYRAVTSRDPRFDGRFFTAVVSTGIYCRPVCPATIPRRRNVRFYACAAAAEEAGFRPCRRCRPETAPGTPAWQGTSATVSRALRLIHEGGLDGNDIERLAARLGVGGRHLRRLFAEHLGATPVAVAQTHRAHFARKLIDETDLPFGRIALSAGFGSVRRFNHVIQRTYGRPPRELRRASSRNVPASAGELLTLRLPYRPPLAWGELLGFLGQRAIPGVESVDGSAYRRTVTVGGQAGIVTVRPGEPGKTGSERNAHLLLEVPAAFSADLAGIVQRARDLFDLLADPLEIGRCLSRDRQLRKLVRKRPGLRVPGAWSRLELAVRAILGQQISVRAATTLAGRVAHACGRPLTDGSHGLDRLFPSPAALAGARLTRLGITSARAETIRRLARAVQDGTLRLDAAAEPEEIVAGLVQLPGIGEWTAQYIAMRALREPDAFPASDLGLCRALATGERPATVRAVTARAESWRPWRAYGVMHLWLQEAE